MTVSQSGPLAEPSLRVVLTGADRSALPATAREVADHQIRRLLGTDIDLRRFYEIATADPFLGPLASRLLGLKPPRYTTVYESLVNAITCQLITLTAGLRILDRLTRSFGPG
ncbi:MAG: DNA-3-methyladenine glycosylase 2 family protein, partial [Chloroflexi bacterium]|nr:DNA-3-methyladenine glycosylase 2 family protein [Chloroflexota bacterium]